MPSSQIQLKRHAHFLLNYSQLIKKFVSHIYPSSTVYSTSELKSSLFIDDDDFQMTNRLESRRTTYWVLTGLTVNYWYLKRGHLPLPKLSRALFQSPLICVTWLPICDCEDFPPPPKPYVEPQSTRQAARWSPAPTPLSWRRAAPHQYGHQPTWTWVGESPAARASLDEGVLFNLSEEQLCPQTQEEAQVWLLFYLNGTLCTGGLIRLTENTNLPHRLSETYRLTLLVSVDKAKSADSTGQYKN